MLGKMVLGVTGPINSAHCETWQQGLERGWNEPTHFHHALAAYEHTQTITTLA